MQEFIKLTLRNNEPWVCRKLAISSIIPNAVLQKEIGAKTEVVCDGITRLVNEPFDEVLALIGIENRDLFSIKYGGTRTDAPNATEIPKPVTIPVRQPMPKKRS
jgi:hypothetical protein